MTEVKRLLPKENIQHSKSAMVSAPEAARKPDCTIRKHVQLRKPLGYPPNDRILSLTYGIGNSLETV